MRIIFVHLGREHLGIEYLSSVLKEAGHEVQLAYDPGLFSEEDNVFCHPWLQEMFSRREAIIEKIGHCCPDMVAFSAYTSNYTWAQGLAREIKDKFRVPILFGGIHATLVPDEVIGNDYVDYIITGEGELSFVELLQVLQTGGDLSLVKGLWYKVGGAVRKNEPRPLMADIDRLPFPDKDMFVRDVRYKNDYMIMVGRGCPYQCSYCCESFLSKEFPGKYVRKRSVENVIRELEWAKGRYGIREVMFFDPILFDNKAWIMRFLPEYRRSIGLPFRCTGHVNHIDEEIVRVLSAAGCYCIDFGIQTFNESIRRGRLNRFESNEQIERALRICDDVGLKYDVDLLLGLTGMTEEDYRLPLRSLIRAKMLNRIKCYDLAYYPGMAITQKDRESGVLDDHDVERIKKGCGGSWFHRDSLKDTAQRRLKKVYENIYKIYPLLPVSWKEYLAGSGKVEGLGRLPGFMVVLFQVLNAVRTRDYRFIIYIKNYWYAFLRKLRGAHECG